MTISFNKVFLLGRVGKDPSIKECKSGKMAQFSLATSSFYKDADGNRQERTEWHSVVIFGKTAGFVEAYVRKGSEVFVMGYLRTSKYEKDGIARYRTDVYADRIQLGTKAGSQTPNPSGTRGGSTSFDDEDAPF